MLLSFSFSLLLFIYVSFLLRHNNRYQWLQIDLGRISKIIRLGTQGRAAVNQWVTYYYLSSSVDGVHFAKYRQNSRDKVREIDLFSPPPGGGGGGEGVLPCISYLTMYCCEDYCFWLYSRSMRNDWCKAFEESFP